METTVTTNADVRIPPVLRPGDTIAVTAPSFGCVTEPYATRYREAVRKFTELGFKVVAGETVSKSNGLGIATNPEVAARELEAFYLDPAVQGIISAGGGELMCETVGYIDFDRLKNAPPKWFAGYSDNTNFLYPLVTCSHTAGLYAHCISDFGKPWEESEEQAYGILTGTVSSVRGFPLFEHPDDSAEAKEQDPLGPYVLTQPKELFVHLPGTSASPQLAPATLAPPVEFSGTVLGGCLDVLATLVGTPLDKTLQFVRGRPVIWFLESCDANPFEIRRQIWHLLQAGWFSTAAGFVIGRPRAAWKMELGGVNQYNAVLDLLAPLGVPLVFDADFGHISPFFPVVLGCGATVRTMSGNIHIQYLGM